MTKFMIDEAEDLYNYTGGTPGLVSGTKEVLNATFDVAGHAAGLTVDAASDVYEFSKPHVVAGTMWAVSTAGYGIKLGAGAAWNG